MKQFRFLLPALTAVLLMLSCTKEGPSGPQGPQGPAGANGTQGLAGIANMIYSGWLSFQQAQRDFIVDNTNLNPCRATAPANS